jgi:hypothetical protein
MATVLILDNNSSFRLADIYTDPTSSARSGVVVNAYSMINIGVDRQCVSIGRHISDNSTIAVTAAVLTNQSTVTGRVEFNPQSQGTVTIAIGNSITNRATFTTTASDVAYFSLNVDRSWGRPQNANE